MRRVLHGVHTCQVVLTAHATDGCLLDHPGQHAAGERGDVGQLFKFVGLSIRVVFGRVSVVGDRSVRLPLMGLRRCVVSAQQLSQVPVVVGHLEVTHGNLRLGQLIDHHGITIVLVPCVLV